MPFDFGYFEEDQLKREQDWRILKRFLPFIRPYLLFVVGSLFLVGAITVCDLVVPYVSKVAIDSYIVPEPENEAQGERLYRVDLTDPRLESIVSRYPELFNRRGDTATIPYSDLSRLQEGDLQRLRSADLFGVSLIAGAFVVLMLLNFGLNYGQKVIMELTGQKIMHDLRLALYNHIQALDFSFHHRNPVGRLVTRVTNDVQNLHELFTNVISFVLKDLFMLLGIAAVLLVINWELALVSFSVLPLVVLASILFAAKARHAFRLLRIKIAEINSRFSETITGIRILQLFRQEEENFRRFQGLNHEHYQAGMQQIRVMALFMPVVEALGYIGVALVIYYGGNQVLSREISIGTLVAFISYIRMFFRPIRDIAEKFNLLQNALASAERIFLILDTKKGVTTGALAQKTAAEPIRSLEMDRVHFAYRAGEPVLQDISLKVEAGEHAALVGPTGSGKTSIINLLMRFYDPVKGSVRINGRDLRYWDLRDLRSRIGLVMQDPYIFSGTIRENIQLGKPDLDEEQLLEVVRMSNCDFLVQRLESGLDSRISAEGLSLSTGERQLLSIARAFARDPELLILDEATSSVDSETEVRIQEALERLMRGRTSLTIAHRLSTVRNTDRIYVVRQGRIIETGSHRELIEKQGFYFKLLSYQQTARPDTAEAGRLSGTRP